MFAAQLASKKSGRLCNAGCAFQRTSGSLQHLDLLFVQSLKSAISKPQVGILANYDEHDL